ncbi:MAG: F0F1 ATP synthase subunit epsilon [Planctomycetes bacterium]|nr:F0F1 ATP synthase subunit epsilon [Planctomycetota bacterium]
MATSIHCTVVTPNAISLDEKATYVSFEAWDGQVGVIAGASPFLTKLGTGVLTVTTGNGSKRQLLADGGFAQMQGENLTLLTDNTHEIASIDAKQAAAALADANQKAIAPGFTSPAARETVERAQRVAQAKVNASRLRAEQRS